MVMRADPVTKKRRRKDRNTLGVLILSISIVIAAFIIRHKSSPTIQAQEPSTTIVAEFDTIKLPVPISYVPTGTKGKDIAIKQVAFPAHQVPKNALQDLELYRETVTIAPLPANLPVFAANFSQSGGRSNPVIERIPAGMRAMTVRVDATSAVEGWATSGAIVDLLLVQNDQTKVIAEKVKIISAERSLEPQEGTSEAVIPRTVTLIVTQEQCLAINTAIPLGKIAFALRGQSDDGNWVDTSYTSSQLKGGATSGEIHNSINGYASIKGDDGKARSFALSDGRWVQSQSSALVISE